MADIVRAEQYNIKFVAIWKVGQEMGDPYAYLTDAFSSFQYVEDLFSSSISLFFNSNFKIELSTIKVSE